MSFGSCRPSLRIGGSRAVNAFAGAGGGGDEDEVGEAGLDGKDGCFEIFLLLWNIFPGMEMFKVRMDSREVSGVRTESRL